MTPKNSSGRLWTSFRPTTPWHPKIHPTAPSASTSTNHRYPRLYPRSSATAIATRAEQGSPRCARDAVLGSGHEVHGELNHLVTCILRSKSLPITCGIRGTATSTSFPTISHAFRRPTPCTPCTLICLVPTRIGAYNPMSRLIPWAQGQPRCVRHTRPRTLARGFDTLIGLAD